MNGSKRAILPIGAIEKMMPLNILPTMLIKSIIANDIETMEQLGIYECDPEDFTLCSFSDASKMDITGIIQDGLDFAEAEG
jgi:Na+-transporting NADH:ubiquinone oxidoreductase subunit A